MRMQNALLLYVCICKFHCFCVTDTYIVDEQVEEHRSKKAALRHALSYAHSIRGVVHFHTLHPACQVVT